MLAFPPRIEGVTLKRPSLYHSPHVSLPFFLSPSSLRALPLSIDADLVWDVQSGCDKTKNQAVMTIADLVEDLNFCRHVQSSASTNHFQCSAWGVCGVQSFPAKVYLM
jgi:hypothetical protein